jgi:CO dehydrogenase nickel-insertion accessory protein CooC1
MFESGTVITFYSHKGGTGRTMALANVGVALARRNAGDVLMVDWDLEAPGLHDFFPEVGTATPEDSTAPGGVLELFERAAERSLGWPESSPAKVTAYWEEAGLERYVTPTSERSLHLMRSGCIDREYGSRVSALPWRELFVRCPDLFRAFAEQLAMRYRYVLIDSRTGLTDTSGICTMLMPERLVVVFNPNRQSLDGAIDQARCATTYRTHSDDPRPLLIFPLVSRVEMSEDVLRRQWRYGARGIRGYQPTFERLFEEAYALPECNLEQYFDEVQIQHATSYAYGERVAVRDEHSDRLSLSRSYQRFVRALLAPGGPWLFTTERASIPTRTDADSAVARVDDTRDFHRRKANRARFMDAAAISAIAVVILATILSIVFWSAQPAEGPALSPIILAGLLAVSTIELGRRFFAFNAIFQSHARAANALDRERSLFLAGGRPYSRAEDPVTLLIERLEEINAVAEEAVLRSSATRSLTGLLRGPRDED